MCAARYWVPLLLCTFTVSASSGQQDEALHPDQEMNVILDRCLLRNKLLECLQEEGANILERALNSDAITITPGVTLQRTIETTTAEQPKSLTSSHGAHTTSLVRFWDNLQTLLNTRSITIHMGDLQEEGRGKKKKLLRYVGVALATAAAILIPVKLKLIAWMAASALLIGKVALVLASLVGLKTLVTKPHEETTHVHYDGHRSDQAQYIAYSGYDLPPGSSVDN